jgi:hypothetical protein
MAMTRAGKIEKSTVDGEEMFMTGQQATELSQPRVVRSMIQRRL